MHVIILENSAWIYGILSRSKNNALYLYIKMKKDVKIKWKLNFLKQLFMMPHI